MRVLFFMVCPLGKQTPPGSAEAERVRGTASLLASRLLAALPLQSPYVKFLLRVGSDGKVWFGQLASDLMALKEAGVFYIVTSG